MVFGSTMLEVAIGMAFVYLLLSLLCSAFSELIESFLKFRARDLEKGVGKLLHDPVLAGSLFNHALIKPLGEQPTYIPARTFRLALWNMATSAAGKGEGLTKDLNSLRSTLAAWATPDAAAVGATTPAAADGKNKAVVLNTEISKVLLTLIDEADNDINKARENVEGWYNDAMDRVSGSYKRRTHRILMVMGLSAAALLNVDTLNVVKALLYNDTLRSSVVASAEQYAKTSPTPNAANPPTQTADPLKGVEVARQNINEIRGEIDKLGLPIGWSRRPVEPRRDNDKYKNMSEADFNQAVARYRQASADYAVDPRRFPANDDYYAWFLKLLGIFITGLAVTQGAPFWFDMLNKIIVIRSTVKPHEKSQDQPSKDKPAPETVRRQKSDADDGDGTADTHAETPATRTAKPGRPPASGNVEPSKG